MINKLLGEIYWKEIDTHFKEFQYFIALGSPLNKSTVMQEDIDVDLAVNFFKVYIVLKKMQHYKSFKERCHDYCEGISPLAEADAEKLLLLWKENLPLLRQEIIYFHKENELKQNLDIERLFQDIIVADR